MSGKKNPVFVESGREGARRRWGPQRVVRLDSLLPEERRVVLALVEASKDAPTVADTSAEASTPEVRNAAANPTT